jgi:osmotically inducible protein OsmC
MGLTILHTAHATATGGRNGHTRNSDGLVDVELSVPKAMGGPGKPGTTTPEDLFAAGYAACFGGAVDLVARQQRVPAKDITVEAAVGIGKNDAGGFGLKVDLSVRMSGVTQEEADRLVQDAHQICPYSNATRNNVEVGLKAVVA